MTIAARATIFAGIRRSLHRDRLASPQRGRDDHAAVEVGSPDRDVLLEAHGPRRLHIVLIDGA